MTESQLQGIVEKLQELTSQLQGLQSVTGLLFPQQGQQQPLQPVQGLLQGLTSQVQGLLQSVTGLLSPQQGQGQGQGQQQPTQGLQIPQETLQQLLQTLNREVGPIVYGYSMTIGPDGTPKVREFGNVKSTFAGERIGFFEQQQPSISAEREPLVDVSSTDKGIKVVAEMPGIKKENIEINAYDNSVEITSNDPQRKYHKIIEIPTEADIETAKSIYNNGILEVIFNKKKHTQPKGKEIKVE